MEIVIIVLLVFIAVLLLIAEMLLLPGLGVDAVLSVISFGAAFYFSYGYYEVTGFLITLSVSLALSSVMIYFSIKNNSLKKMSLEEKIDSVVSRSANELLSLGDKCITKTRLNPMGEVFFGSIIVGARSQKGFVDQDVEVEVVGFDNSIVIVKVLK